MINVRQALPEDIGHITKIERDNAQAPWTQPLFEAELRDPRAHFLCAETEGEIVGICNMHILRETAHINEISVAEARRNQNAATAMLEAASAIAREKRCDRVTLHVRAANRDDIRFYEKIGFKKDGYTWGFYTAPADDALLMCKAL